MEMRLKSAWSLFAVVLSLSVLGCKKDDSEELTDTTPKVMFEGKPDSKFVGVWKTEDGISVYNLDKSGSYKMDSKIPTRGKPILSHLTGNWTVNGDRMLFKDQSGNVAGYGFALKGDKLTLTSTGSLKAKTVMDRKP